MSAISRNIGDILSSISLHSALKLSWMVNVFVVFSLLGNAASAPLASLSTAAVAEFLEDNNTEMGKSIAVVLWQEVLMAIGEPTRNQVILIPTTEEQPRPAISPPSRHRRAADLAYRLQVSLVLWGAALGLDRQIIIDSYVTLVPQLVRRVPQLQVASHQSGMLTVVIPRTRFNFSPAAIKRAHLFARPLVVRHATALRTRPSRGASVVGHVSAYEILQAQDMVGMWFKVQHPEYGSAYIDSQTVDVSPSEVEFIGSHLPIYARPHTNARVLRIMDRPGSFRVLSQRTSPGQVVWYRLAVDDTVGWVSGTNVRPRFSLSVVPFLAGLYHYQMGSYAKAAQAFDHFLTSPDEDLSNSIKAVAYQLRGVSHLAHTPTARKEESAKALEAFSEAIRQTPYDVTGYTLRALATLHRALVDESLLLPPQIEEDVKKALELDASDDQARVLAQALETWKQTHAPQAGFLQPLGVLVHKLPDFAGQPKPWLPGPQRTTGEAGNRRALVGDWAGIMAHLCTLCPRSNGQIEPLALLRQIGTYAPKDLQ